MQACNSQVHCVIIFSPAAATDPECHKGVFVFQDCVAVDLAMMQPCCELHSDLYHIVFSIVLLFQGSIIKILLASEKPEIV